MNYADLELAIHGTAAESIVHRECREVLLDVVEGRLPLTAVCHPLGFFCLPIYRDGELGVCIHVWTSDLPHARSTTSNVHCHSWDLTSFVLYGRVSHTLFQVQDDIRGPDRVFEIHSVGDDDEITPTARYVRCARSAEQVTAPQASYRLASGQFHTSIVDRSTETATVVLGRSRGATDLTIGARNTPGHRVRRRRCSAAETAEIALIAIAGLATASSSDDDESTRQEPP